MLLAGAGLRGDDDPARARGFNAGSMYQFNDIDSINTFNGNLMLSIPVGPEYRTNGALRYQFRLFYNSNVWEYRAVEALNSENIEIGPQYGQPRHYDWFDENFDPGGGSGSNQGSEAFPARSNAGFGWVFSLTGRLAVSHNTNPSFPYHYVSYQSADGAWHPFAPRMHGDITNIPAGEFANAVYYTRDGTYMRSTRLANRDYVIDKPDGTRERFVCVLDCQQSDPSPTYVLDQISDAFGNVVYVQYSADYLTHTYIEKVGVGAYLDHNTAALTEVRRHTVVFEERGDCVNTRRVKSLTVSGPPGAVAPVYSFVYDEVRILRSREMFWGENSYLFCPFDGTSGDATKMPVSLLKKIDAPEGRTAGSADDWTFDYILDPRSAEHADDYPDDVVTKTWGGVTWEASFVAGRVYKVNLPTGGSVRYKYERRPFRKVTCVTSARLGITALGVRERQVLKRDGNPDGQPWRYFRGNVVVGGVFSWCNSQEILSLTVDPLGTATAAFFMATADADWGQPFLRNVPDADGTRFLSSQTYRCNAADFADVKSKVVPVDASNSDPFDSVKARRVVQRYTEAGMATTCGAPVRSTYVRYEHSGQECDGEVPGDCIQANKRVSAERTIYHDDSNTFTTVNREEFDGFGHYRVERTGGNLHATSFPGVSGNDERVTLTNYNPGVFFTNNNFTFPGGYALTSYPWTRINTYDVVVRREGTNGASALFRFDASTGFLQRKRTLATSTPCDVDPATKLARCTSLLKKHDVLVDYERTQSASGETTTIESWYGGDRGDLSTSSVDLAVIGGNPEYLQKTVMQYGAVKRTTHLSCGKEPFLTTEENVVHGPSGLVTASSDSSGAKTTYEYDAHFRFYRIDPPGSDPLTEYTYHKSTTNAGPSVDIATGSLKSSRIEWDHLGRVAMERNSVPTSTTTTQTGAKLSWYHPNGWKEYETTVGAVASGPNQAAGVSYFKYDPFGRVTEVQHPDHVGGSGSTGRRRTLNTYKGVRLVEETIDGVSPDGKTVFRTYDRFGRLVRVNEPSAPGNAGIATRYYYDPQDHLVLVESPNGQQRKFEYDMRGFMTRESHPELGTDKWVYHSAFDPRGNAGQLLYAPPNGTERTPFDLSMVYDPAGRLVSATPLVPRAPDGGSVQHFKFHPQPNGAVPTSGASFLLAGKLQTATRRNWLDDPARTSEPLTLVVTESYGYDSSTGRPNAKTTTAGGNSFTVNYAYNGLGNPTSITHGPLKRNGLADVGPARAVSFQYLEGMLTVIPGYASSISYHRNGTVAAVAHTNGSNDTIVADPHLLPRPQRITSTFIGSATFSTGDYAYDARGNVTAVGANAYAYDAVGRLITATMPIGTQSFAYDANGNMTSFAGTVLPVDAATNRHKTTGTWFAHYDVAGNLDEWRDARRTDITTKFEWDPLRMLTHVSDANQGKIHAYNASNERVVTFDYRSAAPNVVETWSLRGLQNDVLRDFVRTRPASGTTGETWAWRDYIRRGPVPVALVRSSAAGNETLHYHVDHLGSIRRISNASGAVVDHQEFYPFGEEQQERADDNRIKFTGHERDDNGATHAFGDLDYMHARHYTPMTGRFLTMDPAASHRVDSPQTWNRYSYAWNNPLLLIDPDGQEPGEPDHGGSSFIGYFPHFGPDEPTSNGQVNGMALVLFENPLMKLEDSALTYIGCAFGGIGAGIGDVATGLFVRPFSPETQADAVEAVSVGEHDWIAADSPLAAVLPFYSTVVNVNANVQAHIWAPYTAMAADAAEAAANAAKKAAEEARKTFDTWTSEATKLYRP